MEPVLCPVHALKVFALPCPSNRATLKAPRRCMQTTTLIIMCKATTPLRGVPVALFLTDSLGGCEVLKASKPKRSENAFNMYVSHQIFHPKDCQYWRNAAKIKIVFEKSNILIRKSYEIPLLLYEIIRLWGRHQKRRTSFL